jgi:cyclopropane fatty-acyl-phospholipid synthase-like methyltransferase
VSNAADAEAPENRWEERYQSDDLPWDTGRPDAHLMRFVESYEVPAGRALEVGCGTGSDAIWMQQRGHEVIALDISPTAVERAQAKAEAAGVACRFIHADFLEDEVPDGPYQLVFDRGVFHTFGEADERARFAARTAELLEAGGLWHSILGSTDGPPRESGPPRRSVADIAAAVEPHFEVLELRAVPLGEDALDVAAWTLVARKRTHYAESAD